MLRARLIAVVFFTVLVAASATTSAAGARPQTVPHRVTRLVHESLADLNRDKRQLAVLSTLTNALVHACRVADHLPGRARLAAKAALGRAVDPLKERVGNVLERLVTHEADLEELANLIDDLQPSDKPLAKHVHHALWEAKGDLVVAQTRLREALKEIPGLHCSDAASKLKAYEKHESSAERWLQDAKQLAALL